MRAQINLRTGIWAVVLSLPPTIASADSGLSKPEEIVVFSEGLKGRITDRHLRPARLIFDDTSLNVEVDGDYRERFEYRELQIRRGSKSKRLPVLSKVTWLVLLPPTGVYVATAGLAPGAIYLAATLGITQVFHAWDRYFKSHGPHWWSLHSDSDHRCVFLALPRKKAARLAIFEELERRSKKELIVRPPSSRHGPELSGRPVIGQIAPDFVAQSVEGESWSLSQSKGKLILLNFWATWCDPCREELPDLEQLHQTYSDQDFAVVGVSGEDPDMARRFLTEAGITYRALHDREHQIHHLYHVNAIPTTLVIGRDGTLLDRIEGYASKKALMKAVTPYLPGKQAAVVR